jgi:hypothetical protein
VETWVWIVVGILAGGWVFAALLFAAGFLGDVLKPTREQQVDSALDICERLRGRCRRRTTEGRRRMGGISLGGIIVIAGIIAMIFWSFWIGLIVTLIGLIAFGGFARGRWY